jgi:hypothetical protein
MMTKQVSYRTVNEKIFLFIRNTGMHQDCIQLTKKFNSYNLPNFFKKNHSSDLQNSQHMVRFCLSEIFERQLGLENPVRLGLYCTVIRNISESKCVLLPVLTSYSVMATCYDRVGAEYNNCLTVNNARRLVLHGFLTTRSPKQAMAKVLL